MPSSSLLEGSPIQIIVAFKTARKGSIPRQRSRSLDLDNDAPSRRTTNKVIPRTITKARKEPHVKISLIAIALVAFATSASVAAAQDAADPAAGEKVFAKCKLCHQIGEGAKNAVGPELNGAVGRKAGSAPGYNYSTANKDSGITWDEAALKQYLKNPRAMVPGTKMTFAGLSKEKDIDNVIAYLKQFGSDGKKQ
jgi:cytochrome c